MKLWFGEVLGYLRPFRFDPWGLFLNGFNLLMCWLTRVRLHGKQHQELANWAFVVAGLLAAVRFLYK